MKTAEEILTKLKRLDLIFVNSIQIRLGQTFPWKHLGERNEFQNKWRKRIEQYKINILTTWKDDICKKQREICADEIEEEADSNLGNIISAIKNIIRNAPEPE